MNDTQPRWNNVVADILSVLFVFVVLLFAAQGPLQELVKWLIPQMTPEWEELSRRAKRLALKEGPVGGTFQWMKVYIFSKSALFLGIPILASFLILALNDKDQSRSRLNLVLAAAALASYGYWIFNVYTRDSALLQSATALDYVFFPLSVIVTLIFTWRHFGWFIVAFSIFWIIYFFVKGLIPDSVPVFGGVYDTPRENMVTLVDSFWVNTGGVFAAPLQTVSRNVLIFIVFGAILMASGAGDLLLKIANRLTGRFTGGAAHAAVASSALFGTLSGAAISNVVSTGVMTIPVIKRSGFKPAFAGAVEAAASTGGQVMPPVMGVVAFFVAAQIGLDYRYIMMAAVTPAIFYYLGVFLTVYFEARKQGIGPMPSVEREPLTVIDYLQSLVFIIPLGTLTYFLFTQPSIPKAGFYGFLAALITSLVLFRRFRSPQRIWRAFVDAGKMSAMIIIIVAMIGLIISILAQSGFTNELAKFITEVASSAPLFMVLVVLALGAIVLGMGLPPGATYFIMVVALSSGINATGVATLSLHLFVVFFAVISTVTPPVALAAFAAAPIAGADPIRTGWQASRLSIAGFIIPFVFVYHPAVLYQLQSFFVWSTGKEIRNKAMIDLSTVTWLDYGWIVLAFAVAMWLITSALIGFEKNRLWAIERVARLACGFALLLPDYSYSLPALGIAVVLIWGHRYMGGEPSAVDQVKTGRA